MGLVGFGWRVWFTQEPVTDSKGRGEHGEEGRRTLGSWSQPLSDIVSNGRRGGFVLEAMNRRG